MVVSKGRVGEVGFDANTPVSLQAADAMIAEGYTFAIRYVGRNEQHGYDLTGDELNRLVNRAGLGVMVVQHVEPDGWAPNAGKGTTYGRNAARFAKAAGYLAGATLWCDLEGVHPDASSAEVIGFCDSWFDQVAAAGFEPGLYVGFAPGLSSADLYSKLKFKRYWRAYNADQTPIVRGFQMFQYPYPGKAGPNVGFEYDVDVVHSDAMNSVPTMVRAQ